MLMLLNSIRPQIWEFVENRGLFRSRLKMPSSSALRTRTTTIVRVPARNRRPEDQPENGRFNLRPEVRQRIVNKIVETLRRHFPIPYSEILHSASRFERKIYTSAMSQQDYLRKISLKMLSVETRVRNNSAANA
ncbi:Kix domain of CBP (creb binding protein) [Dioscorea alata]|uniref:Kix domain of CBP (Creb binding protein) n=3 Tax=Dioscorea alata TaxID=55571 RepID=A0ACB7U5I9_DIOAL|nr:Kix domain of CBP (creb binding protein) [Dioscorea alata]KAH7655610.1 Kix domain of CBP (creb binding protein) [Dioscorea alata]KAH7655611.1 Kix domain of CBP (creb binding protein) [Dioscorea alata]